MKKPTPGKSTFRRPAGRVVVLDRCSLLGQTNLGSSNSPSIKLANWESVDEPHDIDSLRNILDADVNRQGKISLPPESHNWEGDYGFNIDFGTETSYEYYMYNAPRDKLYIQKNAIWVAKFTSKVTIPNGYRIRVTSIFSHPDEVLHNVHRCPVHAIEDFNRGERASDHFIHCINDAVLYVRDNLTLRRNLIVPYTSPSIGHEHSFYHFKFTCLNSCPGGINNRPVKVIFALENSDGEVVGRRSFEVKVCSTTNWDCDSDSGKRRKKSVMNKSKTSSGCKKRKIVDNSSKMYADILRFAENIKKSYKDTQENTQSGGPYHIKVRNQEELNLLLQAKAAFELFTVINASSADTSSSQTNSPKKPKKPKG